MNFKTILQFSRSFLARQQWRHEFSFRQFPDNSSDRVTTMKLKKQHFSTSNISAIISPIGLKRQNMFIWFLINTLHYNQMEKKMSKFWFIWPLKKAPCHNHENTIISIGTVAL